jgi:hypothetical protein
MQRLIYLNLETGYRSVDIRSKRDLQNTQDLLIERGDHVICTLDINNIVGSKCDCFEAHLEFVQACYMSPW